MLPAERLRDKILTVEGKPYAAYKTLEGAYRFDRFVLYLDHVQGDVHGAPSLMRVRVDQGEAQFPQTLWSTRARRVALEDYLIRQWHEAIRKHARLQRGNPPGSFSIDVGGQQVLERTGCRVAEDYVEIRGRIVLAAEGRKPASKVALAMLMEELPQLVDNALLFAKMDAAAVHRHVEVVEDADVLRGQLRDQGLVAFLGDESVLPREGSTDRPLLSHLVTMQAPEGLRSTLQTTHLGPVTGFGIPRGVTVIFGATFAGKSTLLRAIAAGVYNHIPGDGREHCVTVGDAVLVQTEAGRRIERVDLAPFVTALPIGGDPSRYRTNAATEALAQAAGIMEALEAGSSLLLFDADSTAIPLLMRDEVLARLIPGGHDPFIPLADLLRPLYEEHGISSILVTSLGERYVAAADTVIVMDQFRPRVVTAEAKTLVSESRAHQEPRMARFGPISPRVPMPDSVAGLHGRKLRADLVGPRMVAVGREHIDLSRIEHLVEPTQAKTVGDALVFAAEHGYIDGTRTMNEVVAAVDDEVGARGLEVLSPYSGHPGDYVRPRRFEVAAALNRLRTLHVSD